MKSYLTVTIYIYHRIAYISLVKRIFAIRYATCSGVWHPNLIATIVAQVPHLCLCSIEVGDFLDEVKLIFPIKCRKIYYYVFFIKDNRHLEHFISILPLPLGTLIFCLQLGHLKILCVFWSLHLALNWLKRPKNL